MTGYIGDDEARLAEWRAGLDRKRLENQLRRERDQAVVQSQRDARGKPKVVPEPDDVEPGAPKAVARPPKPPRAKNGEPRKRPPRPEKWAKIDIERYLELKKEGFTDMKAAEELGVKYTTLRTALDRAQATRDDMPRRKTQKDYTREEVVAMHLIYSQPGVTLSDIPGLSARPIRQLFIREGLPIKRKGRRWE